MVTSIKIDIFWLVTTRPIAHSGRFGCIRYCVGEFGTDTGQPLVTSNVMSNHLSYHQKYITHILKCTYKCIMLCAIWTPGRIFISNKTYHFCYIRRTLLVPGVCPCIRIRSMMHYVHTGEAVVTSIKIDIFWLVTTRPIAHSGRFVCIPNCVGEFGTDTGQPLVTSNGMSNHLSYHQKYISHILKCTYKCIMLCAIWTPGRIFISNKTYHFCYQKDPISSRGVSMHSY